MKRISLTQGRFALVDNEDFNWLNQWNWCVNSENMVMRGKTINGRLKMIVMHRLIMQPPADLQIDHKNGDRLDNRRSNLRICTGSQNCMNRVATTKGTTGYKGVTKIRNKYRANIKLEGKKIHLGYFNDVKEAALVYNKAAKKYFGEFALLNNI